MIHIFKQEKKRESVGNQALQWASKRRKNLCSFMLSHVYLSHLDRSWY